MYITKCKINCSGGCPDCAPEEHLDDDLLKLWMKNMVMPNSTRDYWTDKEVKAIALKAFMYARTL